MAGLTEELAHQNRERISEFAVHDKGRDPLGTLR
jgi:catalase